MIPLPFSYEKGITITFNLRFKGRKKSVTKKPWQIKKKIGVNVPLFRGNSIRNMSLAVLSCCIILMGDVFTIHCQSVGVDEKM